MKALNWMVAAGSVMLAVMPFRANAEQSIPFETLARQCAPDVDATTLKAVIRTESSNNPFAIGVVDGQLTRQPRNLPEAIAAARELERQGFNFSLGLGQVNRQHLARYGASYETVFDPCRNLTIGAAILRDCYSRAKPKFGDEQTALRAALSCYYAGNFTRGFKPEGNQSSYVQKVVANANQETPAVPVVPAIKPIKDDSMPAITVRRTPRKAAIAPQGASDSPHQWVTFIRGPNAASKLPVAAPATEKAKESPPVGASQDQQEAPFVIFVK